MQWEGRRSLNEDQATTNGRARLPKLAEAARSMFYCYAVPFIWIGSPDQQETGASMRVSQVTRIPPQSVDPTVKNYHWLDLDLEAWA